MMTRIKASVAGLIGGLIVAESIVVLVPVHERWLGAIIGGACGTAGQRIAGAVARRRLR